MKETKETIQVEHSFTGTAISANRAFQFLIGAAVLFIAFRLWWAGWFSSFAFNLAGVEPEYENGLEFGGGLGLISLLIDTVCLIGIAAISIFGFCRGLVSDWASGMRGIVVPSSAAQAVVQEEAVAKERNPINPQKLLGVLKTLDRRIAFLESLHAEEVREVSPDPPPVQEPETGEEKSEESVKPQPIEVAVVESPSVVSQMEKMLEMMNGFESRLDELQKPAKRTPARKTSTSRTKK